MNNKFGTAINCMDGRVQKPVIDYIKKKYKVKFVDMVTEPGPNKILAENINKNAIKSIKKRVKISVLKHFSEVVVIVGHYDCAGNPTTIKQQKEHLSLAVKNVKKWKLPVKIITAIWVNKQLKVT